MELNLEGLFVAAFLAIIVYMIVEHLKLCNNTQNNFEFKLSDNF